MNIKDAARCGKDGLLPTLVKRSEMKGRKADEVWDFPSVRAVIEYKWTEWAEFHIKIEFILYLGWLIFFVVYMFIYIVRNEDGASSLKSMGFRATIWKTNPKIIENGLRGRSHTFQTCWLFCLCSLLSLSKSIRSHITSLGGCNYGI